MISPAMPAAGMAWPIMDETAPRSRWPCGRRGKTALRARSSARSAAGTPRPWPSTKVDGGGIDAGQAIGAADGAGMTAGTRGGQSLAAAVAGDADALDECVDPIAVALGVAAALENDDAHAFAGEHAVGVRAERPCGSRAREGAQLAEDEREVDVGLEVDAADDRQVGPTRARARASRGRARPGTRRWRRRRRSWRRRDRSGGRAGRRWRW